MTRFGDAVEREGRARSALWWTYAALGALLVAYLVSVLARSNGSYSTWLDGWAVSGFEVVLSGLCILKGVVDRRHRSVPIFLGISLLCWALGDSFLTAESIGGASPPTPSVADAFYICFYPFAYVGILLLMRREIRRISQPSWLDGAVAGLGAAALCAAFAFHQILRETGGHPISVVVDLAYPIGDVLLLSLVIAGTAVLSGRGRSPWALMALGIAVNVVGDTINLFASSAGATKFGSTFNDIAWPTAELLISMSVWVKPKVKVRTVAQKTSGFLLPGLGAATGLAVLFAATLHSTERVAVGLATATLAIAGARLAISARSLRALTEERHRQAVTDELTGLGNRRHLFAVFESFFADQGLSPDARQDLAFLFVDLDRFKEVNDSFGHPLGDELLRQLGPRLLSAVRSTDVVVRLGGDEFAIVLIDADVNDARKVAERVTRTLEEPFVLDMGLTARIGASIGISILETDAQDSEGLLRCADVAMFRAKVANSSFAFYDESLDNENVLLMAEELRTAVENKQFVLHYQPQLDLRTGEITAVEALLRWPNERLGMVPPLKFLPLAEEAGLMPSLTALVLDSAVAQCARWRKASHDVAVSVNLSASNLLDTGFTDLVRRTLDRHQVPAGALVLEVTETCIISDYERSRAVIDELRGLGLVVSIDDFGAGFTSLAYLGDLPVGEVKLDRIFITNLTQPEKSRDLALVRSTIELAHALRLRVVAEGVEDAETLDLLADLRCDVAQGYYIGRPVPAEVLDFASLPLTSSEAPARALVS